MKQPSNTSSDPSTSTQRYQAWDDSSSSLDQSSHWSSTLIWLSSSLFLAFIVWAFVARIDQTITVNGRLQPSASVKDVESTTTGVVKAILVKEGQYVKAGDPLINVESDSLNSRSTTVKNTLLILQTQVDSLESVVTSPNNIPTFTPLDASSISDSSLLAQLQSARNQTQLITSQLQQISSRLSSKEATLSLQRQLAADLKPLFQNGGVSRRDYLRQVNLVQEAESDVQTLLQERSRLLGQVSAQITQTNQQILRLQSELSTITEQLQYRTISAPISGTIFDLNIGPRSVITSDQSLLKIVPKGRLEALVDIGNSDIGFVKPGLQASVSVDSFPSGEFGYIQGTLESIGSDAKPLKANPQMYSFPATISLQQQSVLSGTKLLNLQSGMSVRANIKLRSRPVISIITDVFTRQLEGVRRFK